MQCACDIRGRSYQQIRCGCTGYGCVSWQQECLADKRVRRTGRTDICATPVDMQSKVTAMDSRAVGRMAMDAG